MTSLWCINELIGANVVPWNYKKECEWSYVGHAQRYSHKLMKDNLNNIKYNTSHAFSIELYYVEDGNIFNFGNIKC